jgi:hypothetical protein
MLPHGDWHGFEHPQPLEQPQPPEQPHGLELPHGLVHIHGSWVWIVLGHGSVCRIEFVCIDIDTFIHVLE